MNRNQKIALGCGAAGCLGLIVVAIAVGLIWYLSSSSSTNRNRNYNFNTNSNTNRGSDSNTNRSSNSAETSSSSMSDDDKHKLFQAATMAQDAALLQRVLKKIGLLDPDGNHTSAYEEFVRNHITWGMKNLAFIQSLNTPDKAEAYVAAHIDD